MRISKRIAVVAVLVIASGLMVTGCGTSGTTTPGGQGTEPAVQPEAQPSGIEGGVVIGEKGRKFEPSQVTVTVGDMVTFRNDDGVTHAVSVDGVDLGSQDPGQDLIWTAEKAGTFDFVCPIHPDMTGTITVTE